MPRTHGKLGEREFVDAIARVARGRGRGVRVGVGDDAAVVDGWPGPAVLSTDTMVEGVHFKRAWLSPRALGRRAVRVATSDLAAMGARPRYLLLSLELPRPTSSSQPLAIVRAAMAEAEAMGAVLVGGNVVRARSLSLTVTIAGSSGGRTVERSGACAGDELWVSGHPGEAAGGRRLLGRGKRRGVLVDAYRLPPLRLELGRRLAALSAVTAMMDVSDGLLDDLHTLCRASEVSAVLELDRLPLSPALKRSSPHPLADALGGGDDYELLFAVGGPSGGRRLASISARLGVALTRIGRFEGYSGGARVRDDHGNRLDHGGYRHF